METKKCQWRTENGSLCKYKALVSLEISYTADDLAEDLPDRWDTVYLCGTHWNTVTLGNGHAGIIHGAAKWVGKPRSYE